MSLIEIKNLKKHYDVGEMKLEILKGLTLNIGTGEFVAKINSVILCKWGRHCYP